MSEKELQEEVKRLKKEIERLEKERDEDYIYLKRCRDAAEEALEQEEDKLGDKYHRTMGVVIGLTAGIIRCDKKERDSTLFLF